MAWIIGVVSAEELDALRKLGWEDEDPPSELVSDAEVFGVSESRMRAFFVDNDVYSIMTGPDWEQPGNKDQDKEGTRTC